MTFPTRSGRIPLLWALLSTLATPCAGCSQKQAHAAAPAAAASAYHVSAGWPALPEGFVLGPVAGVALDSHGHLFVFHRANHPWIDAPGTTVIEAPTLLRLEATTGEVQARLGSGRFVVPHGLRVDRSDHLWVTDVGTHEVLELDHEGQMLRGFGVAGQPGDDGTHFNMPTDVAVATDGGFYVSDGYGNARVVRYAPDGSRLGEFGGHGTAPGQFDIPHSIALDPAGRVYVADRGNARIQRFDASGGFIDLWQSDELGRPWALAITPDGGVFVVDGGDQNPLPPDRGRILRLDGDGHVIEKWSSFGNYAGQIYWGHAIAVGGDGTVFVGDVRFGMRVQKFTR